MREIGAFAQPDLPPEMCFILACLRLTPNQEEVNRIEKMSRAKIAWPEFLRWVDRNRVAPLVYTNLSRYAGKTVPSAIMNALRSRFQGNASRGLGNAAELVRLCHLLQENDIPVLPLKGSLLALQVYGNLALRHAGDIDLLIAPHQVELADRLLQRDYRRTLPAIRLTASQQRRFLRLSHHFAYVDNRSHRRLELHWRSIHHQPPHVMDVSRLLSRASTVAVTASSFPGLALPDLVLYLCAHGAHHFWFRLFWLADLAEIMRGHPDLDWQYLMTLARESGILGPLAQGVILAHQLLDVPLPEVMRTYALQDRRVSYSTQVAHRFILGFQPEKYAPSLSLIGCTCKLRCANSFKEKLNILDRFFTSLDWVNLRLPGFLFFIYYLLRFPLWLQRRLRGTRKPRLQDQNRPKDD